MTFLQIFLAGFCFRAGWWLFNFVWREFLYQRRLFKYRDLDIPVAREWSEL